LDAIGAIFGERSQAGGDQAMVGNGGFRMLEWQRWWWSTMEWVFAVTMLAVDHGCDRNLGTYGSYTRFGFSSTLVSSSFFPMYVTQIWC